MPLKPGSSHAIISANIERLINEGRAPSQAEAIAYREAGRARDDDLKIAMDARTIDKDGHLHVPESVITAAQVNDYKAEEIPNWQALGLVPGRMYALLRDPLEIEKAADTLHGKPLLMRHRVQTAGDHDKDVTIGTVTNPVWQAPNLIAELTVWPGDAIAAIESGEMADLSSGYRYTPVMQSGEFNGVHYDGRMTALHFNHVTICEQGRVVGAFVGDEAMKEPTMPNPKIAKDASEEKDMPKNAVDDAREMLKGTASEDEMKAYDAIWSKDKAKDAEPEDPEEEEEKKKVMVKDKGAKDKAKDAEEDDEDKKDGAMDAIAVDAAISAAVKRAVKQAEASTIARLNAVRAAENDVEPYVGKVAAMDNAAAVYQFALDSLKAETEGITDPRALRAILLAHPKPGSEAPRRASPRIAQDAKTGFSARFPNASPLRMI
jgi:hypothetical protein